MRAPQIQTSSVALGQINSHRQAELESRRRGINVRVRGKFAVVASLVSVQVSIRKIILEIGILFGLFRYSLYRRAHVSVLLYVT